MKNKLRYTLLLFLFFIVGNSFSQENKKLKKIIEKIKKQEYLFENYKLKRNSLKFVKMIYKNASEKDLFLLSKMENCKLCFSYSFWVVSKKKFEYRNKLYKESNERFNNGVLFQLNEVKRNFSHLKLILSEQNFIYDIHIKGKYFKQYKLKAAYHNV